MDGSIEPLAARLHRSSYAVASFLANAQAEPMSVLDRGYDVCRREGFTKDQSLKAQLDNSA
jgi:hypothetical protein